MTVGEVALRKTATTRRLDRIPRVGNVIIVSHIH